MRSPIHTVLRMLEALANPPFLVPSISGIVLRHPAARLCMAAIGFEAEEVARESRDIFWPTLPSSLLYIRDPRHSILTLLILLV